MTAIDRRLGVYGDAAVKFPCRVATTANITLDGLQTIDGIALSAGDRVLVRSQTSDVDNGIYVADTGYWTRAVDFDGIRDVAKGSQVMVNEGGSFGGSAWRLTTADVPVIGLSSITFAQTPNGTIADNGYVRVSQFGTGMAALKAAFAASTGKKILGTPGETYIYASGADQLVVNGVDCDIDLSYCTIHRASNSLTPIKIVGGWEEEQTFTPTVAGAQVITVTDATKYSIGEDLKVISDDTIMPYADESKAGEFAVVASISGNNITLAGPLLHAYTTLPRVARIKKTTVKLKVGRFTILSGTTGRLIFVDACVGAEVHIGRCDYLSGAILDFQGCLGCSAVVDYYGGGTPSGGYGLRTQASEKCRLQVKYGTGMRHCIDMGGGDDGFSDFSNRGLSAYNVGHDSFASGSNTSAFAIHHATYRCRFVNIACQFTDGAAVSLRGTENGVDGLESYQDVDGVTCLNSSGTILQSTNGSWARNIRVIDPKNRFVATSAGSMTVESGHFERTQNDTQDTLFDIDAGPFVLTDSYVRVTTGGLDNRIVKAVDADRVYLSGVKFDLRGCNLSADLVLVENFTPDTTDIVLSDIDVIADEGLQLIRIGGTLGTGSLFRDVSLPTASTLCDTIADHLLWQYVRGGISIGLNELRSAGRGIRFVLTDDTAIAIPFSGVGIFNICCFAATDAAPMTNGSFYARTSASATAQCANIGMADATNVVFTTGTVLTGTVGTDARITISAHAANNMIYIENRAGSTRTFALSIPVMSAG